MRFLFSKNYATTPRNNLERSKTGIQSHSPKSLMNRLSYEPPLTFVDRDLIGM